jgi:secernin
MIDLSQYRTACDSLVAMGSRTKGGFPIFAKNSDRPQAEAQPLIQARRQQFERGARLRCQTIEIDQVPETYAFLGSRPHWLWGCEHGLNERGVVIGNHTIFTREQPAATGLCGMDLVRLALERADSAATAMSLIVGLIDEHGQGGSGFEDVEWPYNNSFLIADRGQAWLLEVSTNHWVAREVVDGQSASNHTVIGSDWDRIGAETAAFARSQGWCGDVTGTRFDFAAAYRDAETIPACISSGRFATTNSALAERGSLLDRTTMMRVMRDHYGNGDIHLGDAEPGSAEYFSVCEHADPVGTTTASVLVELREVDRPPIYWAALGTPCTGIYLPLFPDVEVPAALCEGGRKPSGTSAWWIFKAVLTAVEQSPAAHARRVRDVWDELEADLATEAEALADTWVAQRAAPAYRREAVEMMARHWERTEVLAQQLLVSMG